MTDHSAESVATDWPDGFWFIEQLREAVGLPTCALPISPQQAWEEAIAKVKYWRMTFNPDPMGRPWGYGTHD